MNNLPVSGAAFLNALTQTVASQQAETNGMDFLAMSGRTGEWKFGVDETPPEEGAMFVINPNSLSTGFIAWNDKTSKPDGEEMRPITGAPVLQSELPDMGADSPWTQQVAFQLVCSSGEDKGIEMIFKTSSRGGRGAFTKLLNNIVTHLTANQGTDLVVPVVTLGTDSYKHSNPKFGTIYTPIFEIVKWVSLEDGFDSVTEPEPATALAEPEPVVEADPEPAVTPRRRSRRKA